MGEGFSVQILSPSAVVLEDVVTQLNVPTLMGYIGILSGHADLVAELSCGQVRLFGSKIDTLFVSGGYLEVCAGAAKLLCDVVEKTSDIDRKRAEQAKQRALDRLAAREEKWDMARAQAALTRAQERLNSTTLGGR